MYNRTFCRDFTSLFYILIFVNSNQLLMFLITIDYSYECIHKLFGISIHNQALRNNKQRGAETYGTWCLFAHSLSSWLIRERILISVTFTFHCTKTLASKIAQIASWPKLVKLKLEVSLVCVQILNRLLPSSVAVLCSNSFINDFNIFVIFIVIFKWNLRNMYQWRIYLRVPKKYLKHIYLEICNNYRSCWKMTIYKIIIIPRDQLHTINLK